MAKKKNLESVRESFLEGIGPPENFEFIIDDFQKAAIDSISQDHDTLVVAPTGAGKTYIAIEAIRIALGTNSKAIYTTPLKALSNTKFTELKSLFEPQHKVGLLTGDRKIETSADVVVATTEIYRNELYSDAGKYSVVVLDEVHFIADPQRGAVWEESIILSPKDSSLLMLSASISNEKEIAAWVESVRGKPCTIIKKEERPVDLKVGFLHPDLGVLPLKDKSGKIIDEVYRLYRHASLDPSGMRLRFRNKKRKKDGRHKPRRK